MTAASCSSRGCCESPSAVWIRGVTQAVSAQQQSAGSPRYAKALFRALSRDTERPMRGILQRFRLARQASRSKASELASGIMLPKLGALDHTVILQRPLDLPEALEERFARAAARLADVELELPPAAAKTAARVVVVSDFVLSALIRHPQPFCARLADDAPLDPE